jgi:multicomponent Na+:H+ antiporter subunit B
MSSLVFHTATRILKPLMLLFSVFLLVRGHNEPGGGFVGGLVAAAGLCLDAFARETESKQRQLAVSPLTFIALGLLVAMVSGIAGMFTHLPYLSGIWREVRLPIFGQVDLGTPLLFDVGVYLLVCGITLLLILTLMEEDR